MSAAVTRTKPATLCWFEAVNGCRISERAIQLIKAEIDPRTGKRRRVAVLTDGKRFELRPESYAAAFAREVEP